MKNLFWRVVAWLAVYFRDDIITLAMRTPHSHLPGYMNRYNLFNAYEDRFGNAVKRKWWMVGLPTIRVHHILRPDFDRHKHNHPWFDARAIMLLRGYTEVREDSVFFFERNEGDTYSLNAQDYHLIASVPEGGAWTLFITWQYCGNWGFLVDGVHVPWKRYKVMHPDKAWASSEPTAVNQVVNKVEVGEFSGTYAREISRARRPPGGGA